MNSFVPGLPIPRPRQETVSLLIRLNLEPPAKVQEEVWLNITEVGGGEGKEEVEHAEGHEADPAPTLPIRLRVIDSAVRGHQAFAVCSHGVE